MLYGPLTRRLRDAQMVSAVLAVAGPADAAPVDEAGRAAYCGYVAGVLRSYPQIGDVVIWTEPNSARFWKPVSPEAYAALLSACYALLHAARPGVNVIGASAARGTIPPATFWKRVGAAAGALDTVGHNPYPADSSEDPGARHRNGRRTCRRSSTSSSSTSATCVAGSPASSAQSPMS